MKLKVGDVVTLKSGGPEMTVVYVSINVAVQCRWFNAKDESCLDHFPEEALDKVSDLVAATLENIGEVADLRNSL